MHYKYESYNCHFKGSPKIKVLLFLLPLVLLAGPCQVATMKKSRTHPITPEEMEKEMENNLQIINAYKDYPDVVKEAELYNDYFA